jgi:hypothetical protein
MARGEGLWSAGLKRRVDSDKTSPPCVGCTELADEQAALRELTLLWRRGKAFRRHSIHGETPRH